MVDILTPSSIWMQLSNFFFLASALFWDLLVIRICLLAAYAWLLVVACTGYPSWPKLSNPGWISVDSIIWCVLNLLFHGVATAQLLFDERRINFKDPDANALWLFFYRRSGMTKLEFKETFKRCKLRRFKAGQVIMEPPKSRRTFVLLIEGLATWTITANKDKSSSGKAGLQAGSHAGSNNSHGQRLRTALTSPARSGSQLAQGLDALLAPEAPRALHSGLTAGKLYSGMCFTMGLLNVLGVFVAFEVSPSQRITVSADMDALVAMWDLEDLNYLATSAGPAVAAFWRNFTLCQLGIESLSKETGGCLVNARNRMEPPEVLQGRARSTDFTDPLTQLEDPKPSWRRVLTWLPSRFGALMPPGIRHMALPVTGLQACRRVTAILDATTGREGVSEAQLLELMETTSRPRLRVGCHKLRSPCCGWLAGQDQPSATASAEAYTVDKEADLDKSGTHMV